LEKDRKRFEHIKTIEDVDKEQARLHKKIGKLQRRRDIVLQRKRRSLSPRYEYTVYSAGVQVRVYGHSAHFHEHNNTMRIFRFDENGYSKCVSELTSVSGYTTLPMI
jgi:hypothetical protein